MKKRIRLNEETLAKIVKNAVRMAVNEAKKPNDVQHGIHKFKGVRYDTNGNPIYTHEGNTLSPDELRQMGWRISKKHGLCGQISDPTHLYSTNESLNRKIKKVRLTEGDLRRIVNRSVRRVLREEMTPGSISHGTMRNEDVLPRLMSALFKEDPQRARQIWKENPEFLEALCDKQIGKNNPWWESEEANYIAEELFDVMNDYSPEGHYFGSHIGDGSDYGYWPSES